MQLSEQSRSLPGTFLIIIMTTDNMDNLSQTNINGIDLVSGRFPYSLLHSLHGDEMRPRAQILLPHGDHHSQNAYIFKLINLSEPEWPTEAQCKPFHPISQYLINNNTLFAPISDAHPKFRKTRIHEWHFTRE